MGAHSNIGIDKFPRQSDWLGKTVQVCFHYDTSRRITGKIVRDDREAPHLTLIQLADGRVVTATECQYNLPREELDTWPDVISDTGALPNET